MSTEIELPQLSLDDWTAWIGKRAIFLNCLADINGVTFEIKAVKKQYGGRVFLYAEDIVKHTLGGSVKVQGIDWFDASVCARLDN